MATYERSNNLIPQEHWVKKMMKQKEHEHNTELDSVIVAHIDAEVL
jgi:hypothetical protein